MEDGWVRHKKGIHFEDHIITSDEKDQLPVEQFLFFFGFSPGFVFFCWGIGYTTRDGRDSCISSWESLFTKQYTGMQQVVLCSFER